MTPELPTEDLGTLHKEATDLYDLYFRSNAKHKVNVDQDIAMEIFKSKTVLMVISSNALYYVSHRTLQICYSQFPKICCYF